jgi:hypothetical protein
MRLEPLFIRLANGSVTYTDVVDSLLATTTHEPSKEIAMKAKEVSVDLSVFKRDFGSMLQDLIDNGINQTLINYVNSYMKPSLEEIVESSNGGRTGEKRSIIIKAADAPWIEAIVCYNLCLFIKAYGIKEIKQCAVCKKFFTNKGKYAVYCSDMCKGSRSQR